MNTHQSVKIINCGGDTVRIAPGQEVTDIPRKAIPRYGFVHLMRLTDGSYTPVLKSWNQMCRLSLTITEDLGLDIERTTLLRLIRGGFIQGHYITPSLCLFDLHSLYEHLDACKDPEFWDEKKRKAYQQAIRG